jgi:hypothetical protein
MALPSLQTVHLGEEAVSDKRITISKVLFHQKQNDLLQRWCDLAAANGGSFAIEQAWTQSNWYTTYTIEWPEGMKIPEGAAQ